MQKNFLLLLMVANCGVVYSANQKNEIPVISEEEYIEAKNKFEELRRKINELEKKIEEEKNIKDECERTMYIYDTRGAYGKAMIEELAGKEASMANIKKQIAQANTSKNAELKKIDNGIQFGYIPWTITEPYEKSRAKIAYNRFDGNTAEQNRINDRLDSEYSQHKNNLKGNILSDLASKLSTETEAKKILESTTEAVKDIPLNQRELWVLSGKLMDKEFVAKVVVASKAVEKNVNESTHSEKKSILEDPQKDQDESKQHIDLTGEDQKKSSIIEDLKEDQNK